MELNVLCFVLKNTPDKTVGRLVVIGGGGGRVSQVWISSVDKQQRQSSPNLSVNGLFLAKMVKNRAFLPKYPVITAVFHL